MAKARTTPRTQARINQNFIDLPLPLIDVVSVHESALTDTDLDLLIGTSATDGVRTINVGAAGGYTDKGHLTALALAVGSRVLIVQMRGASGGGRNGGSRGNGVVKTSSSPISEGGQLLQDRVLSREDGVVVAFDLALLATQLHAHHQLHIRHGVDLQSTLPHKPDCTILDVVRHAVPDGDINEENVNTAFETPVYDPKSSHLGQRAWLSIYIATCGLMEEPISTCPRIDTQNLNPIDLALASKTLNNIHRFEVQKPTFQEHDAIAQWDPKKDRVQAQSQNYTTRIRGRGQKVQVQSSNSYGSFMLPGEIGNSAGRTSKITTSVNLQGREINKITSIGRTSATHAESQKAKNMLHLLQGKSLLSQSPWLQSIWGSSEPVIWPPALSLSHLQPPSVILDPLRPLNPSQSKAVQQMLDYQDKTRVSVIQGPPGTGKTSVIATYVISAIQGGVKGIWLTAQSNVAVKNLAEKLMDVGFMNWRLLVSRDFIFEWHDHLYHQLQKNVIRSDEFRPNMKKQLQGCQVILCTLSMLSNPRIHAFTQCIPVHSLVVDEASQIELGDYASVLNNYKGTLRKMSFIGDDKQLPPYQAEGNANMQSIFEIAHLRSHATFLDIQYRMPPQLGDFISQAVYESKLNSNPLHPVQHPRQAYHFVDIPEGKGIPHGTSTRNRAESEAVIKIAAYFQDQGLKYRIITPYEAQTTAIEQGLKDQELVWADKCFNVDSFQGNEDDYIIISLARHQGLGFLKDRRRTNVMLTRCKKAMFICSSKKYLQGDGKSSLVGELADTCTDQGWVELQDILDGKY